MPHSRLLKLLKQAPAKDIRAPRRARKRLRTIEVSHYGCVVLSAQKVAKSWSLLRCQEAQAEEAVVAEKGLFVVQPPAALWQNFVKHLDHCFLRADRLPSPPPPQKETLNGVVRAHKDRTSAGNSSQTVKNVLEQDGVWGKAIQWMAADFSFRRCPSLSAKNETYCSRNYAATRKTRQRSWQQAKDLASCL